MCCSGCLAHHELAHAISTEVRWGPSTFQARCGGRELGEAGGSPGLLRDHVLLLLLGGDEMLLPVGS